MKKLDKISKKSTESLENPLDKINNVEDYIIISNYLSTSYFSKFNYDYNDNSITYKEKISIINIPQIFLLNKKDLPTINFCDFDEEWNQNYIDKSLYYELTDCSQNQSLRKEII